LAATPPEARALSALAARLRALREAAGLSGSQLAKALGPGWRQPKVSRIENGQQLPTQDEIEAWALEVAADPAPLLALRAKASAEFESWRERAAGAGGPAGLQDQIGAMERSCTRLLAEYQPALVPGLLQTASFRRQMLEAGEFLADDGYPPETFGPLVAGLLRRQTILHEGGRRIVHVLGEAVLRTRVGMMSIETMRGQLAHIAETAMLPGHELAIVPFSVASPVEPISGFKLYDSDLVVIETLEGALHIAEPELVARFARWLDLLLDAAVTGADAVAMCRRVASELG
jgi:transcriptional regulator with XRE-family HTH domain